MPATALAQESGMPPMAEERTMDIPDVVGHVGVGYFTTTAPLGIRYWFAEGRGIDAGIGISFRQPPGVDQPGAPDPDTETTIGLEFGYLHSIAGSKNLNLFIRPGIGILNQDTSTAQQLGINLNGSLCGEMFLAGLGLPHVSLTAGMGVAFQIVDADGLTTEWGFSAAHTGTSIVSSSALIGAHFYF
jgi:hypothetical protein